jgi:hypothetical protein
MAHFSSAEHNGHFDFVTISEETLGILQLDEEVMVFDVRTKLDFLNLEYLLFLLCFLITFLIPM